MKKTLTLLVGLLAASLAGAQPRQDITINDGWTVKPMYHAQRAAVADSVTLPHTWNAAYTDGRADRYERGTYVYQRNLEVTPEMEGRRLFLYFEGVNSVADVFMNKKTVGQHKGGYTAFCLEITDYVKAGDNLLEVWASNGFRTDVLPISGDFNVQGGIHRPVRLIITGRDCIDPTHYGSPGVFIRQDEISGQSARLTLETFLSLEGHGNNLELAAEITDASGKTVAKAATSARDMSTIQKITLDSPHLWNGIEDPYMYAVTVSLRQGDEIVDEITEPLGLRSAGIDHERGFILNGRAYDLHGFNRHDDFSGTGSALTMKEYRRDMELIQDAGATVLRLAHYPHGEPIYDLCDKAGIVVWSEIPMCGPGGYMFTGYLPSVEENARQTALEMLYQKHHHPSVCLWSVFNELLISDGDKFTDYGNPSGFVREISDLFHSFDPNLITCCAICTGQQEYVGCVDAVAWNKYFGWRSSATDAAKFFDSAVAASPVAPIGVSEYGMGGSPFQHADHYYYKDYTFPGTYHPEEYQAKCHEGYWEALRERPQLWCKIIWQFSDMMSCVKDEGDTPGMNDKGMVTYDRKTLKDSYYFYKANWNPAPMLHLCSARFTERDHAVTEVKAYTTLKEATLLVNGRKIGTVRADSLHRCVWDDVELSKGDNTIRIEAPGLAEESIWTLK